MGGDLYSEWVIANVEENAWWAAALNSGTKLSVRISISIFAQTFSESVPNPI